MGSATESIITGTAIIITIIEAITDTVIGNIT